MGAPSELDWKGHSLTTHMARRSGCRISLIHRKQRPSDQRRLCPRAKLVDAGADRLNRRVLWCRRRCILDQVGCKARPTCCCENCGALGKLAGAAGERCEFGSQLRRRRRLQVSWVAIEPASIEMP